MKPRYPELHDGEWLRYHYVTLGMSTRQIAELVGCWHSTVTLALNRSGIPLRPSRPGPENVRPDQFTGIFRDFKEGKSFGEIAAANGCSILSVMDIIGRSEQEASG